MNNNYWLLRNLKILGLVASMLFFGCSPTKITNENTATETQKQTDEIVFLTFKMVHDSVAGKNTISLVDKTKTTGKIKSQNDADKHSGNYLTVKFFPKNGAAKTMIIAHPLYKHFEYPDDNGKYVSKDVELKEADFFFRLQTSGSSNTVKIFESLQNKPESELITLNL